MFSSADRRLVSCSPGNAHRVRLDDLSRQKAQGPDGEGDSYCLHGAPTFTILAKKDPAGGGEHDKESASLVPSLSVLIIRPNKNY